MVPPKEPAPPKPKKTASPPEPELDNKSEPTKVEVRKPKNSKGLTGWKKVSTATKMLAHQNDVKDSKAELKASMAGVAAAKTIAKNVRPVTAGAKPSDNSGSIQATRKPIKPKMDLAKALSINLIYNDSTYR